MFSTRAFFSFVELTDESKHREYNEWHQLDHLPENLALDGVAWGQRWARRGRMRELGHAVPKFENVDYTAMYWFKGDPDEAVREWTALGEATFQLGRGPLIPGVERRMLAFFEPVEGRAASRIGVGPEILPFRPNRGAHLTLTKYDEPHSLDTHERFRWESQELISALLELDGVAGVWTLTYHSAQRHSTLPFDDGDDTPYGGMRMRIVYMDGELVETARAIAQETARLDRVCDADARASEEVLLTGPVSTITPWEDW